MGAPVRNGLKKRERQTKGFIAGLTLGVLFMGILFFPGLSDLHVAGPMNTGHEEFDCESCHKRAPGTMRQQVQANIRYLFGARRDQADFGYADVDNRACLSCHDRPNDRHPVFRFVEPRFKEARAAIKPHFCISCHLEHTGNRVTIQKGFCITCHQDLELQKDPIDTSHVQLIADEQWDTCLGCHDFHGNHDMQAPTEVANALKPEDIGRYFQGGTSPYPGELIYSAKREASDE